MPAFITILGTYVLLIICSCSAWVQDALLHLLGWEGGHEIDGLAVLMLLGIAGALVACLTTALAVVGLCRKRDKVWNIAALVMSLPAVLMLFCALLEWTAACLELC